MDPRAQGCRREVAGTLPVAAHRMLTQRSAPCAPRACRAFSQDIHEHEHLPLFAPFKLGSIELANRFVMAPLTRNRAGAGRTPTDLTVEYYRQRASAGLIITEASQISPMGQGYLDTPGIYSPEQIAGWKRVTAAVHAAGGRIFIQLWHVGRISHSSLLPDGAAPVAPSAITANSKTFTTEGFVDVSAPRAMSVDDIRPPLPTTPRLRAMRSRLALTASRCTPPTVI